MNTSSDCVDSVRPAAPSCFNPGSHPVPVSGDPSILDAADEILEQGEVLLGWLRDEAYTAVVPVAYNATIGGHYRHCLDHFQSVLGGDHESLVNYDDRRRDPTIETDRFAALNATRRLRAMLDELSGAGLGRRIRVICKASYASCGSQRAEATVGRELMYAVAHAVHHYALIGTMANLLGVSLPEGFGVAPSTLQHRRAMAFAARA
ncbi:MAG: DinB family protein [Limisphaerales bacterium]